MITKTQGAACLREAEDFAAGRRSIIERPSAIKALKHLGWCVWGGGECGYLFDLSAAGFGIDEGQAVLALCFAAAVAGVAP